MIYFLDRDPYLAGSYLADKHLSINLVNTCTALCSILKKYNMESPQRGYGSNNPLMKWGSQSDSNFKWLILYAKSLILNFEGRFNKTHRTSIDLDSIISPVPEGELTEFPQMLPDKYKNKYDSVKAYRDYYISEKGKPSEYRKKAPDWMIGNSNRDKRILYLEYFKELGYNLRILDEVEGVTIQRQEKDTWNNLSILGGSEGILLRRLIDNAKRAN